MKTASKQTLVDAVRRERLCASRRPLVIALGLAWLAAAPMAQAQTARATSHWTVIDLGSGTGNAINNAGQATGLTYPSSGGGNHAFLYSNGALRDLGTLGGSSSVGNGINSAGQITGFSYTSGDVATGAFLYSDGAMRSLGTLGGSTSTGYAINDAGQVTGAASTSSAAYHAFLYGNGAMSDLGTLGGSRSIGFGINNAGQVTGYADTSGDGAIRAFLYSNGVMRSLGTLGDTSAGTAINNAGQVTGYSFTGGATHAFLYSNGVMSDLGTLGGSGSYGYGINSAGQVTGYAFTSSGAIDAFLYSNGAMADLNSFRGIAGGSLTLRVANGINDVGQIIGNTSNNHGYIATLDTVVWESASGGNWDAMTGWSHGINPNRNTAVYLDPLTSLTVTGPTGSVTVKSLNIGGAALGSKIATLNLAGGTITVTGNADNFTTISAKGVLSGSGSITGAVTNLGTVNATNLTLAGGLNNSGTLTGNGQLTGAVNNLSGGTVRVDAGLGLTLIGNASNAGGATVDLGGGELQVTGALNNHFGGRVLLSNGSRLGSSAGLSNSGQLLASGGTASVVGKVTTTSGGKVIGSGNSNTLFHDALEVQSGGELSVLAGSTVTFFGLVSQRTGSTFSGTGISYYEGGLHVGASPGFGVNAGDVSFGIGNTYLEDIGGTAACSLTCGTDDVLKNSSFGKYVVNGHLTFGGTLKLTSWQGFTGQAGDSFDLFDWGSANGTFSSIDASGLQLAAGTALDYSKLYSTGVIDVVSAPVPEPETAALMLAGLLVVKRMSARRGRSRKPKQALSLDPDNSRQRK